MKSILAKPVYNLLIGGVVGAVIVGAVWFGVYRIQENSTIAQVGSTKISKVEFLAKTESTAGSQTLQQIITNQLIEDGASKYHMTASAQEIQTALTSLEQQNGISSQTQLDAALAASNLTMADLEKSLRIQVLEQKLAERNVTVSTKEIQDYYNQNKSQMAQSGKTPALKDVQAQIETTIKQSKAVPASQLLADLAKENSISIMDPKYTSVKTSIENTGNATSSTSTSGQ